MGQPRDLRGHAEADRRLGQKLSGDPLLGARLGDYVIEARVAAGGMGVVYRATHERLKRPAAVKVPLPEYAREPAQLERFLREAKALAAVRHRGIVEILNYGQLPDGRPYMLMEYLEGETLEALLLREGALEPARVLALMDEVLDALSAAHAVGLVHRDLKPANVYLVQSSSGSRYVKLLDFGLVKVGIPAVGARASLVAGTPQYMSPEQAQGLAATPRADLYCFGVMLFELLTGRLPFEGSSWAELISSHLARVAPRLALFLESAPPALDQLVAELLEKDPERRPASAQVVQLRLRAVAQGLEAEPTRAWRRTMPGAPPAPAALGPGRVTAAVGVPRRALAVGLAGLGVLGAGLIVALQLESPAPAPPASALVRLPPPPKSTRVRPEPPAANPKLEERLRFEFAWERAMGESPKGLSVEEYRAMMQAEHRRLREAIERGLDPGLAGPSELQALAARCAGNWKIVAKEELELERSRRAAELNPRSPDARAAAKELADEVQALLLSIEGETSWGLRGCVEVQRALDAWWAGAQRVHLNPGH